ncbi:hypothetical protein D3C78_1472960 [compost metagenome]
MVATVRASTITVCTPYHAAQTSVDVQIVHDWVAQFSCQLNALSFERTGVSAGIFHTT